MKAFPNLRPNALARIAALSAALSLFSALTACGGSGGKADNNTASGSGGGGGGATTTSSEIGPATINGVAAIGAPLLNATVTVVDGKGVVRGTGTTNTSDGSYAVVLSGSSIPLPLLIEAAGVDMTGTPVNLHTVVQSAPSGATRITAHIHPITDAIVAMLLGTDPTNQFKNAATNASSWTQLGNAAALASASDLIKTIVKANITDAKVASSTSLDFFQDANFTANKAALDGVLESLNIQVGQDRGGREQLELSSRLRAPSAPEVTINLSSAKTQLALGATGKVANAISSTAKVTSSVPTLINNLSTLDGLIVTLNRAMAEHADSGTIAALPIFSSSYTYHDGATVAGLASNLSTWGAAGLQLSRIQFTGCADNPMPVKGCAKPTIAALLTNASGQVVALFDNVLTYSTTSGWAFRGNDQITKWNVAASAWTQWDATGTSVTASGTGVLVLAEPEAGTIIARLDMPSIHSVSLIDCSQQQWCLYSGTPTGDLVSDYMLQSSAIWFGAADATRGASYQFATKSLLAPGGATFVKVLNNDVPVNTTSSQFPLPDDITTSTPLTCGDIYAGMHVTWSTWAANNPAMRMVSIRSVINDGGLNPPWIQDAPVYLMGANAADVPAAVSPPSTPAACQLWMVAQDKWGRRFLSKIVAPT